jgi:hypothetical protein
LRSFSFNLVFNDCAVCAGIAERGSRDGSDHDMPVNLNKAPSEMTGEEKYGLLLCVFIAYLRITLHCSTEDASAKIADLCAVAQCR